MYMELILILSLNAFTILEEINTKQNNLNIKINKQLKSMYYYIYGDNRTLNTISRVIIFCLMFIIFIINFNKNIKGNILRKFKKISFEPDYIKRKEEIREGKKIFYKMYYPNNTFGNFINYDLEH